VKDVSDPCPHLEKKIETTMEEDYEKEGEEGDAAEEADGKKKKERKRWWLENFKRKREAYICSSM